MITQGRVAKWADGPRQLFDGCCHKCGKTDHPAWKCNVRSRECELCGSKSHAMKDCELFACVLCGGRGHWVGQCKADVQPCRRCGKEGHKTEQCSAAHMPWKQQQQCTRCNDPDGHHGRPCPMDAFKSGKASLSGDGGASLLSEGRKRKDLSQTDLLSQRIMKVDKKKSKRDDIKHDAAEIDVLFGDGPLGIGYKGNRVSKTKPGGQADAKGVVPGWVILSVDGSDMPNDDKAIHEHIASLDRSGRDISIRFSAPVPDVERIGNSRADNVTAEPSSAAVSAGAGGGAISAGAGGGAVSAGAGGGLGLVDYDSDEGESDDAQPEPEQKPAAAPTVGGVLYAGKLFASQEAVERHKNSARQQMAESLAMPVMGGDGEAANLYFVAMQHLKGKSVVKSVEKAKQHFRQAAALGHVPAQQKLIELEAPPPAAPPVAADGQDSDALLREAEELQRQADELERQMRDDELADGNAVSTASSSMAGMGGGVLKSGSSKPKAVGTIHAVGGMLSAAPGLMKKKARRG